MTNKVKLIIALVLAVLLLVFIIQNAMVVELHILFWTISMSRSLIILFSIFIGMVMGWVINSYFHHRWHKNQIPGTQQPVTKQSVTRQSVEEPTDTDE